MNNSIPYGQSFVQVFTDENGKIGRKRFSPKDFYKMSKKEELKAILDRHLDSGKYSYVDNGDDSVKLRFDQAEVKGEVSISDVGILNLFLAILGGIDNLGKKSGEGCEIKFFLDLINFVTKKSGKKKGIKISQKDLSSLILVASFLKNLIEGKE